MVTILLKMLQTSDISVPSSNSASLNKDEDAVIQNATENNKPKALGIEAATYELETFEKNILIIFNQVNIDGFAPRAGTEKDVDALTKTFAKFGFIIKVHDDCTKEEIFDKLKEFTHCKNDLSQYGCVAVAVLTHGSIYGLRAKDMEYNETEIFNHFKLVKNRSLVGKPIVIIIQACRGKELCSPVEVYCAGNTIRDTDEPIEQHGESDILILHSCCAGYQSHRTWFIQELCEQINLLAYKMDLVSIMTEVKKKVAIEKEYLDFVARTGKLEKSKQMPVAQSTLKRKLFLRKFGGGPPPKDSFTDNKSRNELVTLKPVPSFRNLYCDFVKTCLKYYVEEKPYDETAKGLWDKANTSEDILGTSITISNYLIQNAQDCQCYKEIQILGQPQTKQNL